MSVAKIASGESDKFKFTVMNKLGKSMPSFYLKGNRAWFLLFTHRHSLLRSERVTHRSR